MRPQSRMSEFLGGALLKIRIADLITGTRILCSVALLFCPAISLSFFVLYLASGLTDMIDGPVARKTGTASKLGAKLDTAADFVFVAVCLWKLLPSLSVPLWLWIWIVLIALIKMINMISDYVIQKKYVSFNKQLYHNKGQNRKKSIEFEINSMDFLVRVTGFEPAAS